MKNLIALFEVESIALNELTNIIKNYTDKDMQVLKAERADNNHIIVTLLDNIDNKIITIIGTLTLSDKRMIIKEIR